MAITAGEDRAFHPNQPFSRAEARAAGIGLKTLLSRRFHKIFYDCYVSSTVPLTTRLRAKGGARSLPTWQIEPRGVVGFRGILDA